MENTILSLTGKFIDSVKSELAIFLTNNSMRVLPVLNDNNRIIDFCSCLNGFNYAISLRNGSKRDLSTYDIDRLFEEGGDCICHFAVPHFDEEEEEEYTLCEEEEDLLVEEIDFEEEDEEELNALFEDCEEDEEWLFD